MSLRWAVAVTTAPRLSPTLGDTLRSLAAAGWDNPLLCVEPGTTIPPGPAKRLRISPSLKQCGPYPAFRRALAALLECPGRKDPDFLMVVQDDVEFCRGLKKYLNKSDDFHVLMDDFAGVFSPYSARTSDAGHRGFQHLAGKAGCRNGALTVVITPDTAARFLRETKAESFQGTGVDWWVGKWLEAAGLEYWTHFPSFARHTGDCSSLARPGGVDESRQCGEFLPEIGGVPYRVPLVRPATVPPPNEDDECSGIGRGPR